MDLSNLPDAALITAGVALVLGLFQHTVTLSLRRFDSHRERTRNAQAVNMQLTGKTYGEKKVSYEVTVANAGKTAITEVKIHPPASPMNTTPLGEYHTDFFPVGLVAPMGTTTCTIVQPSSLDDVQIPSNWKLTFHDIHGQRWKAKVAEVPQKEVSERK
ncbi:MULTISPECIES: hypothetical protein [Dermabacter]|uniref:hypothetical protein n=1 Tax=Dermabacter TaxID=36739 RepID=UPI001EF514F4|nr:hypothetical protein [Dermabacter vaginalis]MCG7444436.1 hypothetical protein [Dermabacter vaginalis]MCT1710165.1 hypothetical protein [Dermabacter hominis]